MKRVVPSAFAGNAGEFFVLAELTRRGWTAALTARNNRAYDILASRAEGEWVNIRVKTKTSRFSVFQWNVKPNGIFLDMQQTGDFCALVDIPEDDTLARSTPVQFRVVSSPNEPAERTLAFARPIR